MHAERKLLLTTRIPVRWGDMDAYNHVNNTLYFRYFEQARVEWLEAMNFAVRPDRTDAPVIINASCTFLIPVNYPATVEVRLFAGDPGRSSVMTWYELRVVGDDRLYAEGAAKVVWMDTRTGKSVPLPDTLRAVLEQPSR
ncbi:thioesterase [Zoogloeaceae bacteirum Par-f-2]|nr:thioesterase [Zoogloeaceae bacteirum Par-f-2]